MMKTGFEIVWFAGLLAWYAIRRPFERRARRVAISHSLFDWRERLLLGVSVCGFFVAPLVYVITGFPIAMERSVEPVAAVAGVLTLCAALWLFRRSHVDLEQNWSISLELRSAHVLVRDGVYRFIRHPMYLSFILLGVAQLLLLPNWFAGGAGLAGAAVLVVARLDREEQMMLDRFGEEYRSYMARTKRLIPYVL